MLNYPHEAGFTEPTTSKDAAEAIEKSGRAHTLRRRILEKFHYLFMTDLTADELAEALHESPFSIRPRVTELSKQGLIERTGERRKSCNGRMSAVWRLVRD